MSESEYTDSECDVYSECDSDCDYEDPATAAVHGKELSLERRKQLVKECKERLKAPLALHNRQAAHELFFSQRDQAVVLEVALVGDLLQCQLQHLDHLKKGRG